MFLPWLTLVILNLLDLWTTYEILGLNGREGNPLAKWMIDNHLLVEVKIFALVLLAIGCIWATVIKYPKRHIIVSSMWVVSFGYLCVVTWNFLILATL